MKKFYLANVFLNCLFDYNKLNLFSIKSKNSLLIQNLLYFKLDYNIYLILSCNINFIFLFTVLIVKNNLVAVFIYPMINRSSNKFY